MFLTVRRAIEEWILWIAVDAIEVFMWWKTWQSGEGSISVLLMWLLFLVNGIYLLSLWLKIEKSAGKKLNLSENHQVSPNRE
jgi:nicotinamide riboside transporter PnuC